MTTSTTQPVPSDTTNLARGAVVSFAGAATSAVMGFVLTVVLARSLGDAGSGVVLQAVAVFAIVLSLARAGMDSAAVWILPRLVAHDPARIRGTLVIMLVAALSSGALLGAATIALAPMFALTGDAHAREVARAVSVAGWFIPAGALLLVGLAATRGLGGMVPYIGVGSIGLPLVRPLAVWLVAATGGSFAAVTLAWAAPLPVALIAAAIVLRSQVRRHENVAGGRGSWRPDRGLRRSVVAYALPRTLSAGLEQSVLWLDVILVGILAGSASAGVYGGASRFVAAGLVIDTAIRIVVATRFSTLLFEEKFAELEALYRTATTWLVLFGTPIYLLLAAFAPVVLGLLGPGFDEGSAALVILCVGGILTFTTGNIQSVLLMSGRSGWAAFNKAVVLAVNVGGNFLLVPLIGLNGAAVSWALSMLIDAALATVEVRHFIGIRVDARMVAYALLVPVVTVGIPAFAVRLTAGPTLAGLLIAIPVCTALFLGWCALDRARLHLHDLSLIARK
ncbi:MAG: polysaccharide biosynthesis C-terminal domain-containing protein [Gemmatimonadota bacterium]